MKINSLIVGAGFTGCVLAERIASQLNQRVLLMDKRDHLGGNCYDYYDDHNILVHKYGPHIFHTNSRQVWNYLSQFTEWRPYYHRVLAVIEGKQVPVPFNLNSLHALFPSTRATQLEQLLLGKYPLGTRVPILSLREEATGELRILAEYVYKQLFWGYTVKQWGRGPDELDPSVTARVPLAVSRDNRYFLDTYQGLPKHGYTALFRRMVSHPNIKILLNTDYREIRDCVRPDRLIYTGSIDEYFDYMHGELPYRSLRFDFEHCRERLYQEVAQVNYPNEHTFTRITEFKHLTGQKVDGTTIAFEHPEAYIKGTNIPYYPIPHEENAAQYRIYREAARKTKTVCFAGRLADYRYYNMDQAVARSLAVFERKVALRDDS